MSDESPIILLFLQIIRYFTPEFFTRASTPESSSPTNDLTPTTRRNRRPHRRRYNRYRQLNLENNYIRGCIILRARQITQQNRIIAEQAEQNLVNAILQAREERDFLSRNQAVPSIHTRIERPIRLPGNSEPNQVNTVDTVREDI